MVSVRYKGQVICSLSQDTPVKEALQVILDASRIAPETLKVLYRSRVVDLASSPLLSLKEQGIFSEQICSKTSYLLSISRDKAAARGAVMPLHALGKKMATILACFCTPVGVVMLLERQQMLLLQESPRTGVIEIAINELISP